MGLHERAWSGLNILIFGNTPLLPMQIEQALSSATPNNEIRFDSFEEYSDAFDHSKDKKNVGLILILENCGKIPAGEAFNQLAKPYESKGWPCFGILIHEGTETINGLRTIKKDNRFLSYVSKSSLLDSSINADFLMNTWNNFSRAFEEKIIPPALQETLLSLAKETIAQDTIHFIDRSTAVLSANLNISWIETVALKWAPIVAAVERNHAGALTPHITLKQICDMAKYTQNDSIIDVIKSKNSLCSRILKTTLLLDELRQTNRLHTELQTLGAQNKPGAPALLRHLVNARDKFLKIADDEQQSLREAKTG